MKMKYFICKAIKISNLQFISSTVNLKVVQPKYQSKINI